MELERLVVTFNQASVSGRNEGRRKQVELVLRFADDELKKRDESNPEYQRELARDPDRAQLETLELEELKNRSLECDRLLRSPEATAHAAEIQDCFEWVMAGIEQLCFLERREDLLEKVGASA